MQRPTSLQDRENIGSSRGSRRGVSVGRSRAGAVRSTSIAVVFAGLVLATAQASAQDTTATPQAPAPISDIPSLPSTTTATYGDWVLRCIKTSTAADGPTAESCEIVLTIQLQGQARPIAQLAIGRRQDQNELILTAVLPVNATLSTSVHISGNAKAGEAEKGGIDLEWSRCLPVACFAEARPNNVTFDVMRKEAAGQLRFTDGAGRNIALPLSWRGFTQALQALE